MTVDADYKLLAQCLPYLSQFDLAQRVLAADIRLHLRTRNSGTGSDREARDPAGVGDERDGRNESVGGPGSQSAVQELERRLGTLEGRYNPDRIARDAIAECKRLQAALSASPPPDLGTAAGTSKTVPDHLSVRREVQK